MAMDTWYDLQLQELADLSARITNLLDEFRDSATDGAAQPAPRVRELFDLTDRLSDLLKEVRRDE